MHEKSIRALSRCSHYFQGGTMKKRYILLAGTGLALVIIVAGLLYSAHFAITVSTQGLPASYTDGQTVHFQLTGNLTMHGKTNKEVFDVQGKVVGKTITGTATSTIYMTDFGIQPPNLANIAIAQNKVLITLTFTAKEA